MKRLLAVVATLISVAALAEGKISDAEFNKFIALKKAEAVRDAKQFYSRGDKAKADAAKSEYEKTVKATALPQERADEIYNAWADIQGVLTSTDQTQAEKDEYLNSTYDAATVALMKKRYKEVDTDKFRQEAEGAEQKAQKEASVGRAPTQADLQGSWKFDQDASLAHLKATMGLPDDAMKSMKDAWKSGGETTYTFNGDTVEVKTLKPGAKMPDTSSAKYRIEGNDLIVIDGKRERKMTVGVKSAKELIFSMMGVGTIYRKQ